MRRLRWCAAIAVACVASISGCATSGQSTSPAEDGPNAAPTASALMICGDEPASSIATILALDAPPHSVDHLAGSLYTCTYYLPMGKLVLSVHESANNATALSYFTKLQAKLAPTTPIEGLANLGLPAYNAASGSTVFAKDNMTLQVDASKLPNTIGPREISRNDLSYQVATVILACWKEHH